MLGLMFDGVGWLVKYESRVLTQLKSLDSAKTCIHSNTFHSVMVRRVWCRD